MNSNQFLTLLKKGNDLQKEDFQQLVKLHASFPYFQIPAVLSAKYENTNSKDGSTELLHKAAILSPDRAWLKSLIEDDIQFLEETYSKDTDESSLDSPALVIIDNLKTTDHSDAPEIEDIMDVSKEDKAVNTDIEQEQKEPALGEIINSSSPSDQEGDHPSTHPTDLISTMDSDDIVSDAEEANEINNQSEDSKIKETSFVTDLPDQESSNSDLITSSHPPEESTHSLITSSSGGDEDTRPDLILPDSDKVSGKTEDNPEPSISETNDKPLIEPAAGPPSSRQQILKQLEDNLARLKSESGKNKPAEEDDEDEPKAAKPRRKRSGEDLIDSIKKKEKREIKDTKKKEQNDIIKAFNKKSIKLAAIKENEDVNKLQDLSLPSTKINDRMVSESYAKLLTQQGKKAAAKEIYKKLILKFPQKKAYFADLIEKLEE